MIIRIQSPEGNHRVNIEPTKPNTDLYNETKKVKSKILENSREC